MADIGRDPGARPWLLRAVALRGPLPRTVVGLVNFHGRPDRAGRVEIGYEIFEPFRGRGYASEAVAALVAWAVRRHRVRAVLAAIAPDNEPSIRLVGRLGFREIGIQVDEDDRTELVFELDAGSRPAGGHMRIWRAAHPRRAIRHVRRAPWFRRVD